MDHGPHPASGDEPTRWSAHVVVRDFDGQRRDVSVDLAAPTTVAQVAAAVGLSGDEYWVDGRAVGAGRAPDDVGLFDGAQLGVDGPAQPVDTGLLGHDPAAAGRAVVLIRHTAGVAAGGSVTLAPGVHRFTAGSHGRDGGGFELLVEDDGRCRVRPSGAEVRLNGAVLAGPEALADRAIEVGHDVFEVGPVPPSPGPPASEGVWHRPPRPADPAPSGPSATPEVPRPPAAPAGLSWIMMLAPVPIAVVMAVVLNPFFLAFAAMGPAMMAARWFEGRRTHRRDTAEHARLVSQLTARLDRDLAELRRSETLRRRRAHPDPAEVVGRVARQDPRLWQRRRDHTDAGLVALGTGMVPFDPDVAGLDAAAWAALEHGHTRLPAVPVVADLHRPVGLVGDRATCLSVARQALLSLAVTHGPADLELAVVVAPSRRGDWDWSKWLPHLPETRVAHTPDQAATMVRRWVASDRAPTGHRHDHGQPRRDGPLRLVVVDHPDAVREASGVLRDALATPADEPGAVSAIVVAPHHDELPASATTVLTAASGGAVTVTDAAGTSTTVVPRGLDTSLAEATARRLARLRDPEQRSASAGLPGSITLRALLGDRVATPADVVAAWDAAGPDPAPCAPIGVTADGPLWLDLAGDGPHGLLAGTTGAGKSELLRSLVCSLAATTSPAYLNVVLVDYKGGGAFDACARLPHTVAVVTDLDDHLAARALRSLSAELRHREQLLRDAGASDLTAHRRLDTTPLPRLLVVVDEFATLANELPDFLDALVDIAQRGRSLGVHLLLATQRPSGVLDAKIRANTNIRIALRVQDENDALDVVGTPEPALLSREAVGRGTVRLGAGNTTTLQTAFTGGPAEQPVRPDTVVPFTLGAGHTAPGPTGPSRGHDEPGAASDDIDSTTELDALVVTIAAANDLAELPPPRAVWHPALPAHLDPDSLPPPPPGASPTTITLGRRDLPDHQQQPPLHLDVARHTLVYGAEPATVAGTVAAIVLGLARRRDADRAHLYVVDQPSRPLAALAALPHLGGMTAMTDLERLTRLLDTVERELDRRRALATTGDTLDDLPLLLVVLLGLDALLEQLTDDNRTDLATRVTGLLRDGTGLHVAVLATASHDRGIPLRLAGQVDTRIVHRLTDPNGYLTFGIRPSDRPHLEGQQAVDVATGTTVLVATQPLSQLAATIAGLDLPPATTNPPPRVRTLDQHLAWADVAHATEPSSDPLRVPVGLDVDQLEPALLTLDERVLVVGPPRSGRSTALATIAHAVRTTDPDRPVVHVCPDRPAPESVEDRAVVLVDDADRLDETTAKRLSAMLDEPGRGVVVVVATRHEAVKDHTSWLRTMRGTRHGIVLTPQPTDGEVFRVLLPIRGAQRLPPGRGHLVEASVPTPVQIARTAPDDRV